MDRFGLPSFRRRSASFDPDPTCAWCGAEHAAGSYLGLDFACGACLANGRASVPPDALPPVNLPASDGTVPLPGAPLEGPDPIEGLDQLGR